MRRSFAFVSVLAVIIGIAFVGVTRVMPYLERKQAIQEQERIVRPPVTISSASSIYSDAPSSPVSFSSHSSIASSPPSQELNWRVPFIVQAPLGEWDADHKEACEEASALMVLSYFRGTFFSTAEEADAGLIQLIRRNEDLGFAVDQTAADLKVLLLDAMPSLDVTILENPSIEDLKNVLRDGSLVIVPAAGRMLGNPYYRAPGPPYHMLVIRGFTRDGYAITNDPGTKRGEEYVYTWDVLMNAMHDWNDGDVENGARRVLVIGHPSP